MKKKVSNIKYILHRAVLALSLISILTSCASFPSSTSQPTIESTEPIPAIYQSSYLNPLDKPHTYIEENCIALRKRWDPLSAEPGTVVMIIMFHEIIRGPADSADDTNVFDFDKAMNKLKEQGFKAINTKQFLAFMERNVKIPPRSVLIIQDGTYPGENFEKNFREYWEAWGWPVVNGWVSEPNTPDSVWQENIALEYEGWVDHQAQGMLPDTVLFDESSKAVITRELEGSLTAFARRFGKTPYAFIWPGGGFGLRPVGAARQLGYQLGFTANARGPVMYNWVPLANEVDPARPSYLPEGPINDPLMTLPRYSADQAIDAIDTVRATGKEAAEYAQANKAAEHEYYEAVCRDAYGPLPTP